jgi:HEAT repeat protein
MHSAVRIITLATVLTFCDCIVAQDVAASESLTKLKSRNPQDIASAISSLPDGSLHSPEVARQLTLLLNDERAVVEHIMLRETVGERAWFKLLELPSTLTEAILETVPSLKSYARGQAFEIVSQIGKPNPHAYDMILPYCDDYLDVYVRSRAISALSAVADDSDDSIRQFANLLLDSDPLVKWTVLDALDKRHQRIAVVLPEVIKLLDDDSDVHVAISRDASRPEKLRGRVARLLAKIGPKALDAIPKLKKLTGLEYDEKVRIWSAAAVCCITGTPVPESLDLLERLMLADMESNWVQNDAPEAIAQLGSLARPLLDSLERAKKHKSALIRLGIVDALFAIDPESAVTRCFPLIDDENELVVSSVIDAFSGRGISEPRVIAAYIRLLESHDGSFYHPAASAVDALGKLGPAAREAVPALIELAKAPNISDHLKKSIADALRCIVFPFESPRSFSPQRQP